MEGKSLLAEFIRSANLKQVEFARAVEASPALVSMWLSSSDRRPSLRYALQIERFTVGAVPASSWVRASQRKKRVPGRRDKPEMGSGTGVQRSHAKRGNA